METEDYFIMAKLNKKEKDKSEEISKAKAKRQARKKEVAKTRRMHIIAHVIGIVVVVCIIAAVAVSAGSRLYLVAIRTTSNSNMSEGLTDDGLIDGVDVSEYLTLVDYQNIEIAEEDVSPDEQVESDISDLLAEYPLLQTDTSLEIADGDEVNIDYVGSIDGEEFDGGSSDGAGYDLTIGSGTFIDDFEEQLIGAHPGDDVTVEVTFPDDYSSEDLAGKDAEFAVTINGIYGEAEFNDEFIETNGLTTDEITTADEYRASLEESYYESNLEEYLENYIVENSTVISYPKSYVKIMKALTKYNDEYMASYYTQMFSSYGISYDNVWDYTGDEDEYAYEASLTERARDTVKEAMVYQAIFEDAGLTLDMEAAKAEMNEEYGDDTYADTLIETYGDGYLAQSEIHNVVLEYLMDLYR